MSLAIETDNVLAVLLHDGWHNVKAKSFDLDAYEYVHGKDLVHGGGKSGITATGFVFVDVATSQRICGPLTSVLAVRLQSS